MFLELGHRRAGALEVHHLARNTTPGDEVRFTMHSMLRRLGRTSKLAGDDYVWLESSRSRPPPRRSTVRSFFRHGGIRTIRLRNEVRWYMIIPKNLEMLMSQNEWQTNMYYDPEEAERAVNELHGLGYGPDDLSIAMRDKEQAQKFATKTGTKVAEGAATGAGIGGALGAIVAGLTATGGIAAIVGTGGAAIPLVIGPMAAALAGLGAGGLAGGIVGGLVGLGIPEERAREHEVGLNRGGMLLGVKPRLEDREHVGSLFSRGRDVPTTSENYDSDSSVRTTTTETPR
jgi:Heat induced stress protein YflT